MTLCDRFDEAYTHSWGIIVMLFVLPHYEFGFTEFLTTRWKKRALFPELGVLLTIDNMMAINLI